MRNEICALAAVQYRNFLNSIIDCVSNTIYTNEHTTHIGKVLIVRKGSLGDWICAKPALERIMAQYPQATFHLLTTYDDAASASIFQMPFVNMFNSIINMKANSWLSAFNQIKSAHFDLVIELPADMDSVYTQIRNAIYYRLCGIEQGMGWQIARTRLFHKAQLKYLRFETEQERLQNLLNQKNITNERVSIPLFQEPDIATTSDWLNTDKPYVVLAIGAKQDKRRWPLKNYLTLSYYLRSKGWEVVFIGDEKDRILLDKEDFAGVNLCGKHTIAQIAALLSKAQLCVCNDSGPLHLAYTLGIPVVTIFSARNYPGKWNPPAHSKSKLLVDYDVPCAGCINKPCSNNVCMQNISVDAVQQAVLEIAEKKVD
jgi:ADP-heptose:LPS heptosyltransferase